MAQSVAIQKCGAVDVIRGSNAPLEELHYITTTRKTIDDTKAKVFVKR